MSTTVNCAPYLLASSTVRFRVILAEVLKAYPVGETPNPPLVHVAQTMDVLMKKDREDIGLPLGLSLGRDL